MLTLPDPDLNIPTHIGLLLRTWQDQLATVSLSYNSQVYVYDYVLAGRQETLVIESGVLRNHEGAFYDPHASGSKKPGGKEVDG